jgi:hypothetical protein
MASAGKKLATHTWPLSAEYYDAARRQSDKTFLVMPNRRIPALTSADTTI